MLTISNVTITTLDTATIAFTGGQVDVQAMSNGNRWEISAVTPNAIETSIVSATALAGAILVDVRFSPPLSPTADYEISANALDQSGVENTSSFTFAAPNLQKSLGREWRHGLLQAITRSWGQLIQQFSGRPETILTQDIAPGDTHVFVESTLGFPPSKGVFWVSDIQYSYETKAPASFRNVTPSQTIHETQAAHQTVACAVDKILPPGGFVHLDASGDGSDGVL